MKTVQEIVLQVLLGILSSDRILLRTNFAGQFLDGSVALSRPYLKSAERKKAVPITKDTLFTEISLNASDPISICSTLSEKLGVPEIHSNYRHQIPTTFDFQDPPLPKMNKMANLDLTVRQFASKIAHWT